MLHHLRSGLNSFPFRIPGITRMMSTSSGQSSLKSSDQSCSTNTNAMECRQKEASPSVSSGSLSLSSPIGYIRSCFKSKNGTPRQPSVCSYARAKLQILKSVFVCPDHSLDGLAHFSHVWVVFVFHENSQESFTKAKVKPPRLDGKKVGVFASRSPHRPNPIGLTLARLDKVEGDTLYLSGMDMIDGTPVLDVKPYVTEYDNPKQASARTFDHVQKRMQTYEMPEEAPSAPGEAQKTLKGTSSAQVNSHSIRTDGPEHVPKDNSSSSLNSSNIRTNICDPSSNAKEIISGLSTDRRDNGNSDANVRLESADSSEDDVRVAGWIGAPPIKKLTVRFTSSAEAQLATFWKTPDQDHKLEFLDNYDEAHCAIEDILSADPRSVYRRKSCSDRLYYFTIDNLHITSWFGMGFVEVLQVQPIALADIPKHSASGESAITK